MYWEASNAMMDVTENEQTYASYIFNSSLKNGTSGNYTTGGFQSLLSPIIDKAVNIITIIVLLITMISLGCTMTIDKIKQHIVRPSGVAIAVVAQFVIMPLTAFCLAKVFQLSSIEGITILICGCCPGGTLSNIFALAFKGDMNLSIVMTTCSTCLALVAMPLLLYLFSRWFNGLENAVPYTGIIVSLIMTIVPCGIGIAINHYAPRYSQIIVKVGVSILLIATVAIVVMCSISIGVTIWIVLSPKIMAVGFLMPLIGYLLGYMLSTIFRQNGPCRRTIAMETGCQNIQLCSAILKVAFPLEVIGPLFLFPMIYIVFQCIEALFFIFIFRLYQRFKPSTKDPLKKSEYEAVDNTEEMVKVS